MKELFSNFKGYYKQLILGPLFKLAEAILELLVPIVMANIIDVGIKNGDIKYIVTHGLFMLGLGAMGLLFALICQYFAAVCAFGFGRSLRRNLFKHIYSFSQKEYGTIGTNSLITRLSNDVTQVQTGINMAIRLAIRAPFLIIGSVVMALSINFEIGLIFVVFTPIILFVLYLIMSKSVPYFTALQKHQDNISRLMGESLSGVRVIRAFSRQKSEEKQFNNEGDALTDTSIKVGKLSALLNPLTYVLVNLAIVAILWMGAGYVDTGYISQGQLIALVNYMTQTLLALVVLANIVVVYTKAIASGKRIIEIFGISSSMQEVKETIKNNHSETQISFENVSFSYNDTSEEALTNINFSVKKGQTIGIIGGTGCGKTTVVRLLMREYDATKGNVFVDGANVKDYTLTDLHNKLGIVPQSVQLFRGTIKSNLCLGNNNVQDEEIYSALKTAQGEGFVAKLPQKLETEVEENGKNFSGGQKQRLTIARALLRKPEILILDDSSSALDYATDAALRKALKANTNKMTVIMISQRASTIKNADKILVLDDGAMVGFDSHENLIANCEVYKEICYSQGVAQENEGVNGGAQQ